MNPELQTIQLSAGATLFREGDSADFAYIIETGEMEIVLERPDREVCLARLGPGEIIGEMAIIAERERAATARSITDCSLQVIAPRQFTRRVNEMDPVMRMIVSTFLRRLNTTLQRVDTLTLVNPVETPTEMDDAKKAMAHLRLETEINTAIRENQFVLHYQPIVDLRTGKLAGFEGLMRWYHPVEGLISPATFIPVAETSGQIHAITCIAIEQACAALHEFRIAGMRNIENVEPLVLSINVTAHDLDSRTFETFCRTRLMDSGLPPKAIRLEITESSLMNNVSRAGAVLAALRTLGVGVAIDDFGTGYSSLSQLTRLPISTLKIDMSFVRSMLTSVPDRKMVEIILGIGQELEIPIVAEGVETVEQHNALAERGCQYGQGFLFSKPVPLGDAVDLVRSWRGEAFVPAQQLKAVAI